ncbi:Cytosolic iron-sulfur assembly component 2B [Physocladia obscura]|uniref:Cytosolic iron-sulfur assembly component 2B n=1 Tax=Physocladia obscura TaxID=109957 RepID=A0AAD5T049_9FUNG|nr:Cytosolic iron-sulfur assembly component 2B [Physocladia obscura]
MSKDNLNPTVFAVSATPTLRRFKPLHLQNQTQAQKAFRLNARPSIASSDFTDSDSDKDNEEGISFIDEQEVFQLIRNINDPEHPLTLEQLHVVQQRHITVDHKLSLIHVTFTPTIPHCSMATLIGLCIRVQLLRCLPQRFKVDITVEEGTHQSEKSVNKHKERVAAAMENSHLLEVVNQCLSTAVDKF